tara:strand:- start:858 stop:1412 length:555 start_codon:yes stop_codon:yes gene_type:complete
MQRTDDILGVNRLPNENTKKLMAKKLETDTGAVTLMSEICLKVNNAKDKSKKLRVLRENDSQALRQILKGAFDPKIKWSLPLEGGPIPYKPNDAPIGTEHTILLQEARTLFRFIDGGDTTITQNKRETMFIQLLESLCAEEAEFLINVVSKKLNKVYKGLTANLIKDAFHWDDDFMQKQPSYPV